MSLTICVHDECLVGHSEGYDQGCTHRMGGLLGSLSMLNLTLSPGELLQWLEGRHLHGLMANEDPMLVLDPQPLPQASHHHHHHRRRAAATNPARHCCLSGCTWQDLLTLCPH